MPAAWNGSTTSGGWVVFWYIGEGIKGWRVEMWVGAARVGGKTTQYRETATHIRCCSWYTTLLRENSNTALPLSLSLSASLWEKILSLWGFSQRLQFFLFFPARRIHKNSLKRQLVNEIYYCHRYAFLSFCYVFPCSIYHFPQPTHTFLGRENHSDYDTCRFGFSLAGRGSEFPIEQVVRPPGFLSIGRRELHLQSFEFQITSFFCSARAHLLCKRGNCQEIAAAALAFLLFPRKSGGFISAPCC